MASVVQVSAVTGQRIGDLYQTQGVLDETW
jgi:hypothetical protein